MIKPPSKLEVLIEIINSNMGTNLKFLALSLDLSYSVLKEYILLEITPSFEKINEPYSQQFFKLKKDDIYLSNIGLKLIITSLAKEVEIDKEVYEFFLLKEEMSSHKDSKLSETELNKRLDNVTRDICRELYKRLHYNTYVL